MKVGFIGCGNMAKAMIHGMLGSKKVQPQEMIASAKSEKTREAISSQIGIRAAKTNTEVLEFADIVFWRSSRSIWRQCLPRSEKRCARPRCLFH